MKKLRKGGQGKRLPLFILLGEPAFADVESQRAKASLLALIGLAQGVGWGRHRLYSDESLKGNSYTPALL